MHESGKKEYLIVPCEDVGMRIDQFICASLLLQSRSFVQKLIKSGHVFVNGKSIKASYAVKEKDKVTVEIPEPVPVDIVPEDIPLDILFEDKDLLVINKSAGVVVHPGAGCKDHTMVSALLYYCGDSLSGIGGKIRPGIVHRLDKDTSGCIIIAKNDFVHKDLSHQFQERLIKKQYLAIVIGWVKELSGILDGSIGRHPVNRKKMSIRFDSGREAVTEYNVIERFDAASYVNLKPGTGRTHQLRVHMSHLGNPILGDKEYGGRKAYIKGIEIPRQMLHAHKIEFKHPVKNEFMEVVAEIPQDMEKVLNFLKNK